MTATVVHTKQRQATLRLQCVQASSIEKRTPPMGAPNAACTITQLHDHMPGLQDVAKRMTDPHPPALHADQKSSSVVERPPGDPPRAQQQRRPR
jgi:hypothetical protein